MIKAIISDAGGVFHLWENSPIFDDIKKTFHINGAEFTRVWDKLSPMLTIGSISEEEFWEKFTANIKTDYQLPKESLFLRTYKKGFKKIDKNLITLFKQLKQFGYILAVVSNSIQSHTLLNRTFGLYDLFDVQIISNEVGLMKPDKKIYQLTLEKLQAQPKETVFIDDLQENVKAAQKLGIHGIVYKNPQQLKKSLQKLGVKL